MRFYGYKGCGSCKKALKWLQERNIDAQMIAIRDQPPTIEELQIALKAKGKVKPLFNTSGLDYRAMKLKDLLPSMSDAEALSLLNQHGNLVKRPFIIRGNDALIGFKEPEWDDFFS